MRLQLLLMPRSPGRQIRSHGYPPIVMCIELSMEAGEARLGCPKHFSCEVHRVGVQIAVARQSANLAHAVKVLASPSLAKVVKSQSSSCASAAATLIDGRCLFGGASYWRRSSCYAICSSDSRSEGARHASASVTSGCIWLPLSLSARTRFKS